MPADLIQTPANAFRFYDSTGVSAPAKSPSMNLGAASGILSIGSALAGMVGTYYSAESRKNNLHYQARMAEINGRISELAAQGEMLRGERAIADVTMRAGRVKSAARVAMAANGIDMGEGNAVEIQASTDLLKEMDVNTIRANAVRAAWGHRMNAVDASNQARSADASADGINPGSAAATSLLDSASSVAGSWYQLNRTGAV